MSRNPLDVIPQVLLCFIECQLRLLSQSDMCRSIANPAPFLIKRGKSKIKNMISPQPCNVE